MLAIRLARMGAKKKPAYRVVVMDKRRARNSKSIEIVGHYNPTRDPIELSLKDERIQYWLGQGAQPSDTVRRLLAYEPQEAAAAAESTAESTAPAAESTPAKSEPQPSAEQPPEAAAETPAEAKVSTEAAAETSGAAEEEPSTSAAAGENAGESS